jgi:hypothetical protein
MTPFSPEIRREIGRRDKWTCTSCGNQFKDGWMVEASHFNHDKKSGDYDDPDNGTIECKQCHLKRHIELMLELDNPWSIKSARLQAMSCFRNGFRTHKHYESFPEDLQEDQFRVVEILEEYGLDPDYFICT